MSESSKWVCGLTAEENGRAEESGKTEGAGKSSASQGFTFSDWLEGAVILVMVGALVYKFVG